VLEGLDLQLLGGPRGQEALEEAPQPLEELAPVAEGEAFLPLARSVYA